MSDHKDVFEAIIPWDCIPEALAILKSRDYSRENTGALLQHTAWFMGCSGKLIAGVPPVPPAPDPEPDRTASLFGAMGEVPLTMEQRITAASDEQLESKLEDCFASVSAPDAYGAVDWKKIWEIAYPIMLELLKRWLANSTV